MDRHEVLNSIEMILKYDYGMNLFVPDDLTGRAYASATDNHSLDIIVAQPGHIDAYKWVVRFCPIMRDIRDDTHANFWVFLEERFDTDFECVKYLVRNRADIYRNLYEFILKRYKTDIGKPIAYVCDQKECESCDNPDCHHTLDIKHAKNFEEVEPGKYMEKE